MRLAKLRDTFAEHQIDAILVSQAENRLYLSGFTGSSGWLLISADRALLATDFRYYEQMASEAPIFELARVQKDFADLLPSLLDDMGVRRLGFESKHVTVDQLYAWKSATEQVLWLPLKDSVENLRVVKDEAEVEALRRSAALTDAAFHHFLQQIRPGMTELQAAWEIEAYMREHGASRVAFDLIVAAGQNGALPHAKLSDHVIQASEPMVVDIGCVLDGYCSDMTRTVCLNGGDAEYLRVWEIVLEAQQAALDAIQAGMSGIQADALARRPIEEAGYGEQFGHSLGHGVGLAVHEGPRASRLSEDTLLAGMSLTVEPGIYLPGEFGVRIEDLVIIREKGVEILSGSPKTPTISSKA